MSRYAHGLVLVAMVSFVLVSTTRAAGEASPEEVVEAFAGTSLVGGPDEPLATTSGPLPGVTAVEAADEPVELTLAPDEAIGPRGRVSLWVRTDRTHHGHLDREEPITQRLIEGPVNLDLESLPTLYRMRLRWAGPSVRMQVPGLPGPAWYHLAFEWDAERGIANAYINGTPIRPHDVVEEPWSMASIDALTLNLDRFAVADVRVADAMLDLDDLRNQLTGLYWKSTETLVGARSPAPYVIEAHKGELLYENPLRSAADIDDWVLEGPGEVSFEDGWMRMASTKPAGHGGHIVHWAPVDTPDSFVVEWDFQIVEPHLAIVFFSAQGRDGKDLFDPDLEERDGIFRRYTRGEIDAYHISYYAHNRLTTNLRKNHGFYMPAVGPNPEPYSSGQVRTVQLMKNGAHIQLAVDGEVTLDFHDDGETYGPVLGGGKVGLRQMRDMVGRYRDFRVYEIASDRQLTETDRPEYASMPRPEDELPEVLVDRLCEEVEVTQSMRLPSEDWRFRLDPDDVGRDEQWFAEDLDDSNWTTIAIEQPWQQADYDYVGAAWYRRTIDVPDLDADEVALLEFGAVDESAWVWVNGAFVGEHDIGPLGWDRPFEFDVTEHLRPGQENQITVRALNTAHAGGIWEPIDLVYYVSAD